MGQDKRGFDKDIQHSLRLAKKIKYYKEREYHMRTKEELREYLQDPIERFSNSPSDGERLKKELEDFLNDEDVSDRHIPDFLTCPISFDLMIEPTLLSSGHTYEKEEIKKHFKTNGYTDPYTKETVQPEMIENINLRQAIEDFLEK